MERPITEPLDLNRIFSSIFQAAPQQMAVLDENGRIIAVNAAWRAFADRYGFTHPDAGVGENYLTVTRASGDPLAMRIAESLREILTGRRRSFSAEYPSPAPDQERWFELYAYCLDDRRPTRVVVSHRDVTETHLTSRALKQERAAHDVLLEHASDGVLLASPDGRILEANPTAAEMFGYEPGGLEGLRVEELLTERSLESKPIQLEHVTEREPVLIEREGRTREGGVLYFEANARRLDDGRVLAVLRDITERRKRTEELHQRTAELTERVKEQQCLYAASRLLATPDRDLTWMLERIVDVLPHGWQFPELAEARIELEGIVSCQTPGFAESPYRQTAPIVVDSRTRGKLTVTYRAMPRPEYQGGSVIAEGTGQPGEAGVFLYEERALIDELASRIGEAVRQHRAEDQLRRSEAYFRTLTEKSTDLVSITAADGRILYQSPGLRGALGVAPEERIGQSVFEPIHPDDVDTVRTRFEHAVRNPEATVSAVFRIRHASGGWRTFESTSRNLLDDPAVAGIVIESRDITERVEAERRIRFHADLLDAVGQVVVATDAAGRVRFWNRAAEELFGATRSEATGRRVLSVIRGVDPQQPGFREVRSAVPRGERWIGELIARDPEGTEIPLFVAVTPLPGERGAFNGALAVATDISDRKAAETALRQSEERLRALIEHSSDLTVVLDADGRITYSSPNRERLLGVPSDDEIGRSVKDLMNVHPDDRGHAAEVWQRIYSETGAAETVQLRIRHGDGSWRMFEVKGRNLLDTPGVQGVVVNARDVTDRAQLEHRLQQAQKMEAIGRLAGGIAHDFNNLLTGIRGYSQLALEELASDAPIEDHLRQIERAANRAAQLTRQLLAFSRRQVMQPRVVDLNAAVADMHGMLTRLIGEDVKLVTDLEPDIGCVRVDPGQLEQVVLNLAVNGRDAMPMGGELRIRTRRLRLEAQDLDTDARDMAPGDYLELAVRDTGMGMEPSVAERAFEPFFTTKEVGRGTGLGLSTVYGIVRQSGGSIQVESEPGAGTTFRVHLKPIDAEPDPEKPGAGEVGEVGDAIVLLVEDDAAVRQLARRVLAKRGFTVHEAGDGVEALSRFRDLDAQGVRIDLVISDVVMPRLGGRQLVETLRDIRPTLPVILMSGYTDDVVVRHGAREVGADFMEKPFTPAELTERARAALDRAAAAPAPEP